MLLSLTGSGSVTVVESVQKHSGRGSSQGVDQGLTTDYSLAGIDLKRVRHTLAEVIQHNKDRWKELSVQGIVVVGVALLPFFSLSSSVT